MTTFYAQVVDENGEVQRNSKGEVLSFRTHDYVQMEAFVETVHRKGFEVREPWADITTVSTHEAGWASKEAPSTIRKLADMGRAHKEGASDISIA